MPLCLHFPLYPFFPVLCLWLTIPPSSSHLFSLQDPNEDTEWNDILRKKGILPPKEVPKDDEEEELAVQQQSIGKKDDLAQTSVFDLLIKTM